MLPKSRIQDRSTGSRSVNSPRCTGITFLRGSCQGGVITCTDLSVLFHHGHSRVAELIREYEAGTEMIVPRRGNLHDMGRTVTHKRIICRKAYLEGKPTHVIARETSHSPEAVDHYTVNLARVYFAVVQRGMQELVPQPKRTISQSLFFHSYVTT